MGKLNTLILLFVVTVAIASCATNIAIGPTMMEIEKSIPAILPGEGRIYFYNKTRQRLDIFLDGQIVGEDVKRGSFFFVDCLAGDTEVSINVHVVFSFFSTSVDRRLLFELTAGEEKYIQCKDTYHWFWGHVVSPYLVTKTEALAEMAEMHYIGPPLAE
jgi:hypothetical protein